MTLPNQLSPLSAPDTTRCGSCEAAAAIATQHDGKHRDRLNEAWAEIRERSAAAGDGHLLCAFVHVYAASKNYERMAELFAKIAALESEAARLREDREALILERVYRSTAYRDGTYWFVNRSGFKTEGPFPGPDEALDAFRQSRSQESSNVP